MKRQFFLFGFNLLLIGAFSCKKQGTEGLQSLIDMQALESNQSCPQGGIIVKSGIDKNRNNVLDANEVDNTKYVCNGQNGQSGADKQTFLPIYWSANTTSTTPIIGGELLKFSKKNYVGVDSIILVANPYVADQTNTAEIEVYNMTDNVPIANSKIVTNNLFSSTGFLQTGNLYSAFPDKEIRVGISLKS